MGKFIVAGTVAFCTDHRNSRLNILLGMNRPTLSGPDAFGGPPGPLSSPSPVSQTLKKPTRRTKSFIQYRYVLIFLGFCGLLSVYGMRVNLNVAIVSMVNHTAVHQDTKRSDCFVPDNVQATTSSDRNSTWSEPVDHKKKDEDGPYVWDPVTQGLVLGAFYWGYVVTPIPGGWMAERFGAKWLFGGGTLVTALLGLLIPVVTAEFGHVGLIILRILQGLGEGVTYPAMETQLANWIPKNQRTTAVSLVHVGGFFGVVVGMFVSGELAASSWGWPSIFYVFGVFTIVWAIIWFIFTSDSPEQHFLISQEELDLIVDDLGEEKPTHGSETPWKEIWLSMPAWASHVALFGTLWLQFTLVTLLPTYLGTVLGFDIKSNGFYSALPYIGAILAGSVAGPTADTIRRKEWMSVTGVRKLYNGISLFVPSVIICLVVAVAGCNGMLSLALFIIAGAVRGISEAGCYAIPIDMAPDFAGTVFGVSVSLASFSGILVPYITGALTNEENTTTRWSYTFYITGAVGIICGLFFQIFASADVQPWGLAKKNADSGENNK